MLFRKRVLLDSDPQELARVKMLLDRAGIKYDNAVAAKKWNYAYSATGNQSYLYQVFVAPRDHAAAKKAIGGA